MNEGYFIQQREESILRMQEKQKLRQIAMFIGIAMLLTASVSLFFAPVYLNIMSAFGIDRYTAAKIANDPMGMQLINQILSVLMFVFPFLIVLSGCSFKFNDIVSLELPDKKSFLPIVLLGLAFCGFANIASNLLASLFSGFGFELPDYSMKTPDGPFGIVVTIIGAAVIAPLTEEFAMRGIMMGSLRKYGEKFAIITSAVLFGLMHGNLRQIPFAFIVGLILGFAVIKTGSLWTGVAIHFLNNLFASVLTIIGEHVATEIATIINLAFFGFCILCGFISMYFMDNKTVDAELLSEENAENKRSAKIFFTSPFIIAYIVIVAVEIVIGLM